MMSNDVRHSGCVPATRERVDKGTPVLYCDARFAPLLIKNDNIKDN